MAIHLALDDKLVEEALIIGHHKHKKAVVIEALQEYIQRRKQQEIIKLFHTIDYDENYDYKAQRQSCAVSVNYQLPIFTTDKDFDLFAEHLPIKLYKVS